MANRKKLEFWNKINSGWKIIVLFLWFLDYYFFFSEALRLKVNIALSVVVQLIFDNNSWMRKNNVAVIIVSLQFCNLCCQEISFVGNFLITIFAPLYWSEKERKLKSNFRMKIARQDNKSRD